MQILLLSPYHGGSHAAWANGYTKYTQHQIDQLTLPARMWKWRMHGGAATLAHQFKQSDQRQQGRPDLLLATDMLDLGSFLAQTRHQLAGVPAVLYMHENQLTYPLPADKATGPMRRNHGLRERQYVLINWKSMLAADKILFNSDYHKESWFEALPVFLRHYQEFNEIDSISQLIDKSETLPVGIDFSRLGTASHENKAVGAPPLILWNQRWEFDKDPAEFFDALRYVKAAGHAFRLAVCGENFQRDPKIFTAAQADLADEIIHFGFADSENYRKLLWAADITISTAIHEFFGISILEAIYARTFPILPARLSYPEIIPAEFHAAVLYKGRRELHQKIVWAIQQQAETKRIAGQLATQVQKYGWRQIAVQYDQKLGHYAHILS